MSKAQNLYLDLEEFITPRLLDDFCSYDEETQSFNIVLAVKQIIEAKEQENEKLKDKNQHLINTYCHFKNETKKYKKAVHKYKVVLQDKIERLHLSRREFLKEINSMSKRIACNNEDFRNALNNFNNAIQVINNEDKYKQALDEIEKIVKRTSGECFYDDINNCENCDMNLGGCSAFNLRLIKGIISKVKEIDNVKQ